MGSHLAIIGASYLQLPLIEKAKEMGYTTHVFAWAANDVGEKAADYFYPISIVEKEEILTKCREIGICGICSIASDLAMVTVSYVAEALGLPGNTVHQECRLSRHHFAFRIGFHRSDIAGAGRIGYLQAFQPCGHNVGRIGIVQGGIALRHLGYVDVVNLLVELDAVVACP